MLLDDVLFAYGPFRRQLKTRFAKNARFRRQSPRSTSPHHLITDKFFSRKGTAVQQDRRQAEEEVHQSPQRNWAVYRQKG
jgi:hypothetical protein